MKNNNSVLFALSASKKLGNNVAKYLHQELGNIEIKHFDDGETLVKSIDSLRNKDVYVLQSTSNPVNENLMELLIAIDSFKRASARSINVIIPYFGYSRQDRKTESREPITCKLVSKLIENSGATRVTICDLHADQTQGFFEVPVDTVSATYMLLKQIKKDISLHDAIIVSPDYGSVKRARKISNSVNLPMAILDKRRPKPNSAEIVNVLGNVVNKTCIIIDDIIDTGGTLIAACNVLKQHKAKKIVFAATHGLFSKNACHNLQKAIKDKKIDRMYITNTLDTIYNCKIDHLKIVDISPMIGEIIKIYQGIGYKTITNLYNKTKIRKE